MTCLISAHDISLCLPDGKFLFQNFNFHIGKEKIGMIGQNGVGKSSLLQIILQQIKPTQGTILVKGKLSYLPQNIYDFSNKKIATALNVEKKICALKNVENGVASLDDLLLIDDDWDFIDDVESIMKLLHLEYLDLNRLASSLSGGELMRILFARVLLEKPDMILLDEPTNNLDHDSKQNFYNILEKTTAGMLIISHDHALLNKMDKIIEISNLGLKMYGGNFDFYLEQREIEDDASQNRLQCAEQKLKEQNKIAHEIKNKINHKLSHGKERSIGRGMSPLEIGVRVNTAGKTTARLSNIHESKVILYQEKLNQEKENLRDCFKINIDIEKSKIPKFKEMIICKNVNYKFPNAEKKLWKEDLNFEVIGNQRVSLSGKNGSGKTTLIHLITRKIFPTMGHLKLGTDHFALLDQKCSLLEGELTILENMKRFAASNMKEHEIRIRAGRFLFYGEDVFKKVIQLSGGERLRVALACLLATSNAPDVLILDEPTNNLDLDSIEILIQSLNKFEGCLIVVSHDLYFLSKIRIDMEWKLENN